MNNVKIVIDYDLLITSHVSYAFTSCTYFTSYSLLSFVHEIVCESSLAIQDYVFYGVCKVEFIQPSNWLYSMPNLLVFQHLVTLYLGGLVVRVVSEIESSLLKSVQENRDLRLGLTGDSRLQAAKRSTRAKHARR